MKANTTSAPFKRLVSVLKDANKTCTTIEQSCGGLISSGIMAVPGASKVYVGGTIAYNTKKIKPLLLNDTELYDNLNTIPDQLVNSNLTQSDAYVQSKVHWTAQTSIAYCKAMNTDYAIAEGGATGPTFRPNDMKSGFSVLAIAGRDKDGSVSVLQQKIVRSDHANRVLNMHTFANEAANLATSVITNISVDNNIGINMFEPSKALKLDRATNLRSKTEVLLSMQKEAAFVVLDGSKILVRHGIELALIDEKTLFEVFGVHKRQRLTFLGIKKDENHQQPIFGIDLLESNIDIQHLGPDLSFVDTRTTAPLFNPLDNEIALHATAYAEWQRRTTYCTLCGKVTEFVDGGTRSQCTNCRTSTWPRQDPSMIAVISSRCQQKVLLARSKRHPRLFHTVLAGFVEAGETLEAAVAREAFEETGVVVDEGSVQYIGSQPWPFPQSCMIGFTATADATAPLVVDTNELVAAAWFDKTDVIKATTVEGPIMQHKVAEAVLEKNPSLNLLIPPKGVIARKLIDHWLESS